MVGAGLIGEMVAIVRARTGVDFVDYREPTLERRIESRMGTLGIEKGEDYLRLLERSEAEARALAERITIKVSRFYRHAPTFDLLRGAVLPRLAALGRPVCAWSAGCGRGEEPYTLAMLFDEAGIDAHVTASDIDPLALELARAGVYPEAAAAELPPALRSRYLEPQPGGRGPRWRVAAHLRDRVRFEQHDLVRPRTARFDLVCCRNVLIYWSAPVQVRLLANLCAALAPGGYLCLGEAEWPLPPAAAALEPIAPSGKIFRAAARA